MMTVSPARALSTACTALNAASPVSAGTSSYNASAFNADESVTVSFTDSGAGAGGTPMTADVVLLHSRDHSITLCITAQTATPAASAPHLRARSSPPAGFICR
ncbi:hypothetical protein ACM92P_003205 [Cronobacter dublinensis]